jgi:TetR/AcrR family transcriptional regulator, tetracycline repressor protein
MVKPGPKRTLSRDAVVTAAVALLDDHGVEAVSVRSIAARLGVAPNAVYTYFPSRAAVLQAVVDRLIGEQDLDVLGGDAPWPERVRAFALGVRANLLRHPGAAGLLMGTPMSGPNALEVVERLLAVLAEAGLSPLDAARAGHAIIAHVLGAIALEASEFDPTKPAPPEPDRVVARRLRFAALSAKSYPRTAAAAAELAENVSTEQFVWGLDRLIAGLAGPDRPRA